MTTLDQMWTRLAQHQPFADERGYGPAWKRMCEERTEEAALAAGPLRAAASAASAWAWSAARWAAKVSSWAEFWADMSPESAAASKAMGWDVVWAERAIEHIEKAEGEQ